MTEKLIVALHGVGSTGANMETGLRPLAATALIIAPDGPESFNTSPIGRQWFSVAGVTETNRPDRVAAAMPKLLSMLDQIAQDHGVSRHDLILLGFSQGAIMTIAAIAGGHFHGRAIAVAGRLAADVKAQQQAANLLLVHDRDDPVMPLTLSVEADAALSRAGHKVSHAWTAGIGHAFGTATITIIQSWLEGASLEAAA